MRFEEQEPEVEGEAMFSYKNSGTWKSTLDYLAYVLNSKDSIINTLTKYAEQAISELKQSTPRDTGLTANSWEYEIIFEGNKYSIVFKNTNFSEYISVVVLIEYGHLTRNGIFIEGRPFVNKTLDPIFESLENSLWKELS